MIKNYNQYIKEYNHFDVDPFGEEDWGYDNDTSVIRIAKQQGKPFDQITELYCNSNQLTNLNGIENLTNLKELYCSNNNFSEKYKEYLRYYCKKKKIFIKI